MNNSNSIETTRPEDRDFVIGVEWAEVQDHTYRLMVWDTHTTDRLGKSVLGYELTEDGRTLFEGEDFACSPVHAIDSHRVVPAIMGFLTLKPGDTDPDYFEGYTPRQMAFAEGPAEHLAIRVDEWSAWWEDDGEENEG